VEFKNHDGEVGVSAVRLADFGLWLGTCWGPPRWFCVQAGVAKRVIKIESAEVLKLYQHSVELVSGIKLKYL
jgi:hypothetical protein